MLTTNSSNDEDVKKPLDELVSNIKLSQHFGPAVSLQKVFSAIFLLGCIDCVKNALFKQCSQL